MLHHVEATGFSGCSAETIADGDTSAAIVSGWSATRNLLCRYEPSSGGNYAARRRLDNRVKIESAVLPQFRPMRLAVRREPFGSSDWLYELKYDGFRALALIESGSCFLISRHGQVLCDSPAGFASRPY
jgi:ATP-dependent DNA ligase